MLILKLNCVWFSQRGRKEGKFVDSTVKFPKKVKLECIYPKKAVIMQASWMKFNVTNKENIAVLHPIYGIHIKDKYNGRTCLENTSREDKSLSFIKSTLEDVSIYSCCIVTYPDGIWEKAIEITQPGDFEVSEKIITFTKPGGNGAFTCPYKIGQQVVWERVKADQVDTGVLCHASGKQSFGPDFKECAAVDRSDQANAVTALQYFAASGFAMYHCVATGRNKTAMSFSVAEAVIEKMPRILKEEESWVKGDRSCGPQEQELPRVLYYLGWKRGSSEDTSNAHTSPGNSSGLERRHPALPGLAGLWCRAVCGRRVATGPLTSSVKGPTLGLQTRSALRNAELEPASLSHEMPAVSAPSSTLLPAKQPEGKTQFSPCLRQTSPPPLPFPALPLLGSWAETTPVLRTKSLRSSAGHAVAECPCFRFCP
ncbi:LOW QUALITY PROTEIN: CD226 antigen [Rhynochetos jubatus]